MSVAEKALTALSNDQARHALSLALDAWRQCRHPVLSQVVRHLDDRARSRRPDLALTDQDDFHTAWMDRAAEPLDHPDALLMTGWLSTTLTAELPGLEGDFEFGGSSALKERCERLRFRGPDPRIGRALSRILERAHAFALGSRLNGVLQRALRGALEQRDPHSAAPLLRLRAPPLEAEATRSREWAHQEARRHRVTPLLAESLFPAEVAGWRVRRLLLAGPQPPERRALPTNWTNCAAMGIPPARLFTDAADEIDSILAEVQTPEDIDGWRTLLDRLVGLSDLEKNLLAITAASPTRDEPRHVYSDYLMSAHPARGEGLALALADQSATRTRRLWWAHRDAWLGPYLAEVLSEVVFERGLPCLARLGPSVVDEDVWTKAAADERLQTFEDLSRDRASQADYERLVLSSAATGLRVVEVSSIELLDRLRRPREKRKFRMVVFTEVPNRAELRALASGAAFSELRYLVCPATLSSVHETLDDLLVVGLPRQPLRLRFQGEDFPRQEPLSDRRQALSPDGRELVPEILARSKELPAAIVEVTCGPIRLARTADGSFSAPFRDAFDAKRVGHLVEAYAVQKAAPSRLKTKGRRHDAI